MLRHVLYAVAVLGLSLRLTHADEFKGKITRVADGKVTISVKEKGKKAEAKDLKLAKEVKVYKFEAKEKVAVADGLKADVFNNIDAKKGLQGRVVTNADNQVTEIVLQGKKKKKE